MLPDFAHPSGIVTGKKEQLVITGLRLLGDTTVISYVPTTKRESVLVLRQNFGSDVFKS